MHSKKSQVCTAALVAALFIAPSVLAAQGEGGGEGGKEQRTAIHTNEKGPVSAPRIVVASWYGESFQGKPMSNGEPFDAGKMTVAHKYLPFGTRVRLRNLKNGRKVIAVVTDRGPYVKGRDIDLSKQAARVLGILESGTGLVEMLEIL